MKEDLSKTKLLKDLPRDVWGSFEVLSIPSKPGKWFFGKGEDEWTFEFFLHKLRNAISHGHVDVDSSMNFAFWDEDGTRIKYKLPELVKFTYKLYGTYLDDWNF